MKPTIDVSKAKDEKQLLFIGLDEGSIEWRPYKCFLILYLFNATIALPAFAVKLIYLYFG
jgi:hypothetical protein